ncbi:MAG: CpaF family protein [Woeseiaceae bacterium]
MQKLNGNATAGQNDYETLTPVRKEIQERVQDQLDLYKRNLITDMSIAELREEASRVANEVIESGAVRLPDGVGCPQIIEQVVAESIGLGPIEPLLQDESISEVMVNGPQDVYVEQQGRLTRVPVRFIDARSLMSVIERIVTPLGRRIDEGAPMVDARLADGSRVNAIIPPLSLVGPVLTIRKFSKKRFDMDRLIEVGTMSREMADFLEVCVEHRRNVVVSGGTGSGKTTLLNALSDFIPDSERIVTIEDAAELRLSQRHVISLEARPANVEGKGHVAIRDLVRNSLRMRPDRIVVGECRGGEALDMLQAMNTGHDGSMTTGHANSPRDLLSRLEVMVLMSGMDLPVRAIREQISSAVDVVVQQSRFKDGKRRVTDIVEIRGMEGDTILLQTLFKFQQQGLDADGNSVGTFSGAGYAPRFYEDLLDAGVELNTDIFHSGDSAPDRFGRRRIRADA